jgi:hypothetical protein
LVHFVHIWRHNNPGQPPIQLLWEADIGVIELREEGGGCLIDEDDSDRSPGYEYSANGECCSENTLTRMVSERGRDIDSGVGVVDEMKFPHPLYSVLNPMNEPGTNEV